ncbi:MAG: hypothetical protein HOP29_03040 [Phycisphaerales bacterium]|nr:hypothetical protein [Phycisphaerales bacterium]
MSGRSRLCGLMVLALAFVAPARAADSIEDIGKKITAAMEKLKSFSAKSKTVTEMKQEGFSMISSMDGTMEMLHEGENWLMRSETKAVMESEMGGNKTKQESTGLMINDGEFSYTLSDTGGMKSAYKNKMQKMDTDPFKSWHDSAELKVLPDETIDGNAAWVIEALPKGDAMGQGKSVIYYHKDSGQMLKMVVFAPDGTPMTTTTMSDIKLNPSIAKDRFVFKAPEGVTVQDMSNNP